MNLMPSRMPLSNSTPAMPPTRSTMAMKMSSINTIIPTTVASIRGKAFGSSVKVDRGNGIIIHYAIRKKTRSISDLDATVTRSSSSRTTSKTAHRLGSRAICPAQLTPSRKPTALI